MENVIAKYLTKFWTENHVHAKDFGPVITISRDFGCGGTKLACLLQDRLNKKYINKWKVINREILERSAVQLHSKPQMISHVFNAEERGFYAEIIESFSGKYYISDNRIKRTINKVIKDLGEEGHVIIVGRAGYVFTGHIEKSLHVKLIAPLSLRVNNIANKLNISCSEARIKVVEEDERRKRFLQIFDNTQDNEHKFDVVFNMRNFSANEILEITMKMAESRRLI
jgi:cytidylate kinase